jgi:hypothetical protein
MSSVYLDRFMMRRESKSYIDSLHAVLTAAELFTGPKYLLSGLTGMAFKFSVHERLLPLSVSAYGNWGDEHEPAVENVGLLSFRDAGRTRHPTFRFYQQAAIDWTRRSLDRGIGVIYWIPEFGVIRGYDDEDSVFFMQDGMSDEDQIVLYDNLGLNFTGFWYAEAFADVIDVPLETMVLESIRLALDDWKTPHKTLPNTDIGSGRLAYKFMILALLKGNYDVFGARYIIESYIYARDEIRRYLEDIHHLWPELVEASRLYAAIGDTFEGWDMADVPSLVHAFETAVALEERAMDRFRELSDRLPNPKRTVVPRWGKSTPR